LGRGERGGGQRLDSGVPEKLSFRGREIIRRGKLTFCVDAGVVTDFTLEDYNFGRWKYRS
jgi:hypothetical protein